MEIKLSEKASNDLEFWKKTDNKKVLKRIRELIEDIQESPFKGLGKPEPLKYNWSGYWSRRINKEHRLVYKIESTMIYIASLRFHY